MKWLITEDLISRTPEDSLVGRGNVKEQFVTAFVRKSHEFRLLDDDGTHYLTGVCDELDFAPLDWAMDMLGCTEMQYRTEGGTWETL